MIGILLPPEKPSVWCCIKPKRSTKLLQARLVKAFHDFPAKGYYAINIPIQSLLDAGFAPKKAARALAVAISLTAAIGTRRAGNAQDFNIVIGPSERRFHTFFKKEVEKTGIKWSDLDGRAKLSR